MKIIAEIGHNWNGEEGMAIGLISAAKIAGADYVKFQLYDVDKIKKPHETNYAELKKGQVTQNQMHRFYHAGKKAGIEVFFSIFDTERLGWVERLEHEIGYPMLRKIATRTFTDIILTDEIIRTAEAPVIITGNPIKYRGKKIPKGKKVYFLYSQSRRDILTNGFDQLASPELYDGYSDHTIGIDVALKTIGLFGNKEDTWLEKHFTFDKNFAGWDQPSSMTPDECYALKQKIKDLNGTTK